MFARRDRVGIALSMSAVALLAAAVYVRALGFAFFNDDPTGHFAWMEGRTLLQFFTSAAAYGYYRPVVFASLRTLETLFGGHNPVADHALLLLLHGANVALVWHLSYRLSERSAAFAWATALVLLAVPFHYEAVAYVASLTHPLLVFWLLVTLLLFDAGRRTGRAVFYALALLTMILGLLSHENGLFILAALVGQEWVIRRPDGLRRLLARPLPIFVLPPVLYGLLWLTIPKNSDQTLLSLRAVFGNAVPFLQTLVFPLLPAVRLDPGDTVLLLLLAFGLVTVTGLLAWRARALRLWVFALGWIVLSALPATLFLSPAYVYGSPRLSYLPAVGVAMLWAVPVLWLWRSVRTAGPDKATARWVLTAIYLLFIVLPPVPFVRCQLDFYAETSRMTRAMAAAAATAPQDREVVFVNAPFFFSSYAARPEGCPNSYPWTPVGGILIPPYAQARDFVRFNGGPDRAVNGLSYPGYQPGWRTFGPEIDGEMLRQLVTEQTVFVFDIVEGRFTDLGAHWQPNGANPGQLLGTFGDILSLTDARMEQSEDWLDVDLAWRVDAQSATPLTVFVHVYDSVGALMAQSDGPPGTELVPTDLWQAGDALSERHQVDLSELPAGNYTVAVGVYDPVTGLRLRASSNDTSVPNDAMTIGQLQR